MPPPRPSSPATVWWLVLAFVVCRVLVLLTGIDSVYFDDELATGVIGAHLIEGLRLPLFDYQIADHLGGTLLVGVLAAPVFLVAGEHLLALKLVPMVMQAGAMVLWYHCCDRYFGRRAAVITALLFILSPQLLTRFSLVAVGFHPESLLFTAAAVVLLFRITSRRDAAMGSHLAFGAVCGLGVWVGYIFVPTLVTCLIYWTVVDRRWMLRRTVVGVAAGMIVGLIPWLVFNATHDWSGLAWITGSGGREPLELWTRAEAVIRYVTIDLFRSFGSAFDGLAQRVIVPALYVGVAAVGYLSALRAVVRGGSSAGPVLWLVVFPAVLAVTYGANLGIGHGLGRVSHEGYDGFRYLVPLYPVLLVLIARVLAGALAGDQTSRRVAAVTMAALLVAGATSTLQLVSRGPVGRAAAYAATSYKEFGYQRGPARLLDTQGLSAEDRASYDLGRGWNAAQRLLEGLPIATDTRLPLTTEVAVLPAPFGAPDADAHLRCAALADEALSRSDLSASCEWLAVTAIGAGHPLSAVPYYRFETAVRETIQSVVDVAPAMPARSRPALFEGLGQSIGTSLEFTVLDRFDVVLAAVDEMIDDADRQRAFLGFGRGVGWRFVHDPVRAGDLINKVGVSYRESATRGLREFEQRLAEYR